MECIDHKYIYMATKRKHQAKKQKFLQKDAAKGLEDLFEDGLKDLYWAEKLLPKHYLKCKKCHFEKLKKAIGNHLKETEGQVARLEACFKALGKNHKQKV